MIEFLLWIAKRLPRGASRTARFLARHSKSLQHYSVQLKLLPEVTFIGDLRDNVFNSLWLHGCYPHQVPEDLICRTILQPGDVVYDIGANIGYTAILYADAVGKRIEFHLL
mgnify:CR=1 FL=1